MSEQAKVYSGNQIKGLFSRPQSIEVIVEHKTYGTIKFLVKPMNNDIYAQMGLAMKENTNTSVDNVNNIDALKVFANVYYPAMKVVLPYCCVSPAVVDGVSKDDSILSLTDIPMEVTMDLFNQIMATSGLTAEGEEERKN